MRRVTSGPLAHQGGAIGGELVTSSEVQRISRVSGDQQRNFRRSGYIAKGDGGWTKFELMDVAELTIIGFQLERKTPPSVASKIARKIAPMVCAHAIRGKGAMSVATALCETGCETYC